MLINGETKSSIWELRYICNFFCEFKTIQNKSLFETKQKSQAYNKVENNPEFVVIYVGSKVKSFPEELNPKQSFKNATEKVQREIRSLKKVPNTAKSKKVQSFKSVFKNQGQLVIRSIGHTMYLVEP